MDSRRKIVQTMMMTGTTPPMICLPLIYTEPCILSWARRRKRGATVVITLLEATIIGSTISTFFSLFIIVITIVVVVTIIIYIFMVLDYTSWHNPNYIWTNRTASEQQVLQHLDQARRNKSLLKRKLTIHHILLLRGISPKAPWMMFSELGMEALISPTWMMCKLHMKTVKKMTAVMIRLHLLCQLGMPWSQHGNYLSLHMMRYSGNESVSWSTIPIYILYIYQLI